MKETEAQLRAHNLIVTLYGSTRYDDPKMLDADIMMFGEIPQDQIAHFLVNWSERLTSRWTVGQEGGALYTSFSDIRTHLAHLDSRDEDYIEENYDAIHGDLQPTTTLLTGYPLLSHNPTSLEFQRSRLIHQAVATPYFGATIVNRLGKDLGRRHERRNLPPPQP